MPIAVSPSACAFPHAKAVVLAREGVPQAPMTRDEEGVWSLTTEPLDPDYWGYSFLADGVRLIDPGNPLMKPNLAPHHEHGSRAGTGVASLGARRGAALPGTSPLL